MKPSEKPLPTFLWDRAFGSFEYDVSLEVRLDGWNNVNVVKYGPDQVNSAVERAIPYHNDPLIPTLKQSVVLISGSKRCISRESCAALASSQITSV